MIFVTVGTHEQQFNRLIEYVDGLKKEGIITEEVIMQTGFSTYEPKYCTWKELYPYSEMIELVKKARIIITHGGPSSFIMPLQVGKTPVVVPRQKKYNEHVNDHQVEFCKAVDSRMGTIILVNEIDKLKDILLAFDQIVSGLNKNMLSNNLEFNRKLKKIIQKM